MQKIAGSQPGGSKYIKVLESNRNSEPCNWLCIKWVLSFPAKKWLIPVKHRKVGEVDII